MLAFCLLGIFKNQNQLSFSTDFYPAAVLTHSKVPISTICTEATLNIRIP